MQIDIRKNLPSVSAEKIRNYVLDNLQERYKNVCESIDPVIVEERVVGYFCQEKRIRDLFDGAGFMIFAELDTDKQFLYLRIELTQCDDIEFNRIWRAYSYALEYELQRLLNNNTEIYVE